MANGNGKKEAEAQDKNCPFIKEVCIGGKCALYSELKRNIGGLQQNFGTCGFNALVLILSEVNQKTLIPEQSQIRLPKLIKG